jgi:SSS family solute:Na+ symporter
MQYNNTIPLLMAQLLPNGVLGIAMTGLLAAFMAGMAANVSSFNTVVTYDIIEPYIRPGMPDQWYLRMGRIVTVCGVLVAIGTAFIASGYQNIMDYIQLLFSFFNAPLFATFIIALFWKRATPWAGVSGLAAGTLGAAAAHYLHDWGTINLGTDQAAAFWGAAVAFIADAVVTVLVSLVTQPKPVEELRGLVWSETPEELRRNAAARERRRRRALAGHDLAHLGEEDGVLA